MISRTVEGGNMNSNNRTVGQIHFCNLVHEAFSDSLNSCSNWRSLFISISNTSRTVDWFNTTIIIVVFMLFFISL